MKVVDLLKEQKLIKAKYFTETDQSFVVEVNEQNNTAYLSDQIRKHYSMLNEALKRYMEIEDLLSISYAKTTIEVMGYRFSVASGLRLLQDMEQVTREPITGKYIVNIHPMGVFLSMCSASGKVNYSCEPRKYVDPLGLLEDTVIEDVSYKVEEFLIQLKYAIEKSNNETEV